MARILIADDDPEVCDFLRRAMQRKVDAQVEIAANGAEALEMLTATPFDLAIIDMYMPHLTGLEVLRAVRRKGLPIKIILLTGMATVEVARKAWRSGAQDFQEKPIILHGLVAAVQSFLEDRKPYSLSNREGMFAKEHGNYDSGRKRKWYKGRRRKAKD